MAGRKDSWCFTSYLDEEPSHDKTSYLTYQREICPKTKKEHWQGYAEFTGKKTFSAAQKALKIGKSHMEPRKGTPKEAADYCQDEEKRKPETEFFEFGTRRPEPEQGKRNDIHDLRDAMIFGDMEGNTKSITEIMLSDNHVTTLARFGRFAERCNMYALKLKTREFRHVEVILHWGERRTGKTRIPYEEGAHIFDPHKDEWWDGYDGEQTILIDEFYGQLPAERLLRLLDGYQCRLPIKGGFTYAEWTKVYITCNVPPENWWVVNGYDPVPAEVRAALMSRITKRVEFKQMVGSKRKVS